MSRFFRDNTLPRIAVLAIAISTLAGCGGTASTPVNGQALVGSPDGAVVATVNGEAITEPLLMTFARGRGLDPTDATQRRKALDLLVETLLLAQYGITSGLTNQTDVQAELALVRMQQLSGRAVASLRSTLDVSEVHVLEYYQQEAERAGDTEWRLQHILFDDQAAADAALQQAQQPGADFEQLMADYQGKARQARMLDWGNGSQLPPELVVAAKQLQVGDIAPVAVKTQYGWHVIRLAESRPFAPPPLDQVRDGARKQLIERAMAENVAALKTAAKITGEAAAAPAPAP